MTTAQSAVAAALAALGLSARIDGAGVYVERQGHMTVTEAATLAAELAQMEEVDRDLAQEVVGVLAGALELIDELSTELRQAHAELRRGIRELSVHGVVAPRSMELAITRSLPTLTRAREFAPAAVAGEALFWDDATKRFREEASGRIVEAG